MLTGSLTIEFLAKSGRFDLFLGPFGRFIPFRSLTWAAFGPPRRVSARFGRLGGCANLTKNRAPAAQDPAGGQAGLPFLPGQGLIGAKVAGQKHLPVGDLDQVGPTVTGLTGLKVRQGPGQVLFAEADTWLNRPAKIEPGPDFLERIIAVAG